MFYGRISAETCLKMDNFGSVSPKSPNAEGSASRPPFSSMSRKCAKTLFPLNIFG